MNNIKKMILLIMIAAGITFAQTYKIASVTGSAKILGSNDKWIDLEAGTAVPDNSLIVTEDNSSVKLSGNGIVFALKESSAVQVSNIKQMTLNELLLALAMEDIMNAPRKKENHNGKTTAVYGTKEGSVEKILLSDEFGAKRINGALQLAENGFKESAVVSSKEIFRKYPETKKKAGHRIYFANLLFEFGLYEEAYDDFVSIKELKLSEEEKAEADKKISLLNKKLVNN